MRLAEDEIKIKLDHETIYLRPSLRAAFRLERKYDGFYKIIKGIADGNFSIMADVIRESADPRSSLADFLDCIEALPLRIAIERISEPLIAHVTALAGVEPCRETTLKPALKAFQRNHLAMKRHLNRTLRLFIRQTERQMAEVGRNLAKTLAAQIDVDDFVSRGVGVVRAETTNDRTTPVARDLS
jgi:hypothetical protein